MLTYFLQSLDRLSTGVQRLDLVFTELHISTRHAGCACFFVRDGLLTLGTVQPGAKCAEHIRVLSVTFMLGRFIPTKEIVTAVHKNNTTSQCIYMLVYLPNTVE